MTGSFASEFLDWMTHQITVEPWLGSFDAYGQPEYGAPVTLSCHIQGRVRMVKDSGGNDRASSTTVYIAGGPLDVHDRITMPSTFKGPSKPPIISVSNLFDHSEYSHCEVYL